MSKIDFDEIHKYSHLDQGIELAANELLEDRETYYLVTQLKLAREALERRLTRLEEEYSEGLD